MRRLIVLLAFTLAIIALVMVMAATVEELIAVAPTYRANLDALVVDVADLVGFKKHPTWEDIYAATIGRIDLQAMLASVLASLTSFSGTIFLIVVYAGFLIAERETFARKFAAAFPQGDRADRVARMVADINHKIADYLAVKTLVNFIVGAISYVVMLIIGLDFALFWAVLIALFNYIPYVGSLIAVILPVVLSVAQFGSIETTVILAALLILAQFISDNLIEPRLVGRQLNLSPFVVLVALSFWSAIWGLPGAILAIPMTSMLTIIFDGFPATRFIAIFLAERAPGEAPGKGDGTA